MLDSSMTLVNGLYRPGANSPAVNAAAGSYVTDDMDGQARNDGNNDVGADEASSANVTRKPLTAQDVGPLWMR